MPSDISSIRRDILNCELCRLRKNNDDLRNANNPPDLHYGSPVPGIGFDKAKIMIFGEAPGADEVLKGRPFVGKAGALLRECLEEVGLQPNMIYIANVVNCRPPQNKFPSGVAGEEVVKTCLPWARKQLAAIRPQVVLGLGSQPLKYIYQSKDKLSDVLGTIYDWHIKAINLDTKYIPSLHPSFCLRPGRSYADVLQSELSSSQKMMTLSISEKIDIIKDHLLKAVDIIKENEKVKVIAFKDVPSKWQENDQYVYIGRPGKGSDGYFGNPIITDVECPLCKKTHTTKQDTIPCYRRYFYDRIEKDATFAERVHNLKSKTLVCFCKPNKCHGDVIAEYLNDDKETE